MNEHSWSIYSPTIKHEAPLPRYGHSMNIYHSYLLVFGGSAGYSQSAKVRVSVVIILFLTFIIRYPRIFMCLISRSKSGLLISSKNAMKLLLRHKGATMQVQFSIIVCSFTEDLIHSTNLHSLTSTCLILTCHGGRILRVRRESLQGLELATHIL